MVWGPELIMNGTFLFTIQKIPNGTSDSAAGINSEWCIADGISMFGQWRSLGRSPELIPNGTLQMVYLCLGNGGVCADTAY